MNRPLVPMPRAGRVHASRPLLALLLGVVLVLATATPASAHAVLLSSSPGSDVVLDAPPSQVVLTFSEPISIPADAVRVFDPSGREVRGVESSARDATLTATLPTLDEDGSYTVAWKMVSADGHALRGAYLFHLRSATLSAPVDVADAGVARWPSALRALGSVLAIGSLAVALAALPRVRTGRRRPLVWGVALAGTVLSFVAAVLAVGSTFTDGVDVTMSTTTGRVSAVAVAVVAVGFVTSWFPVPRRAEQVLAFAGIVALALEGHAVALDPVARSASLTVLHVLAAVCWVAGLLWLEAWTHRAGADELHRAVRRRSPYAAAAVLVLAATGVVLVLDRVPLDQLLSSWYGRIAIVKVALLGIAVILAIRNRTDLTPALVADADADAVDGADGDGAADGPTDRTGLVRLLRASVRAEIVVLSLALVAGAILAQIPPPEEGTTDGSGLFGDGGSFQERLPFGDGEVELTVDPGARGTNEVHVTAIGADGRLMAEIEDLQLSLTLDEDDIGPLQPEMQRIVPGHSVAYAKFPFAGEWTVEVTATQDRFTALEATFTVPIGD